MKNPKKRVINTVQMFDCSQAFAIGWSENHRLIEWLGLKGTFESQLIQHPCNEQGRLQLDEAPQSHVWPDLEHWPPLWATCANVSPLSQ